jgi:hypothetical protein
MANFVANELKKKDFTSIIIPSDIDAGVNRNNLGIIFELGESKYDAIRDKHPLLGIDTMYFDTPIPKIVLLASGLSESNIDDFMKKYLMKVFDNSSKKGGAKRTRKNRKVRSRSS